MPTLDQIKQQANDLGNFQKNYSKSPELSAAVQKVFSENELIISIAQGRYNKNNGLLIATTEKLIFSIKQGVTGRFQYDLIEQPVQFKTSEIQFAFSGHQELIKDINSNELKVFRANYLLLNYLRKYTNCFSEETTEGQISQLERLKVLHKEGYITKDEFLMLEQKVLYNQ